MSFDKLITDMALLTCAQAVRGILTHSNAHWRTLITCAELEHSLDRLGYRVSLAEVLELITKEDTQAGRPPCTAVVIDSRTRQPWGGFFNRLRDLDVEIKDNYSHWLALLSQLGVSAHTAAEQRESAGASSPEPVPTPRARAARKCEPQGRSSLALRR
jgi:hypothetical protein